MVSTIKIEEKLLMLFFLSHMRNIFHVINFLNRIYFNLPAPPSLQDSNMKDGHAYESLPLVYTVQASGTPKPTVRWLHNGEEVKACPRVKIVNDGDLYKLEIARVNMKDAGKWECEISNDLGKNVLKAELTVSREYFIEEFHQIRDPNILCVYIILCFKIILKLIST